MNPTENAAQLAAETVRRAMRGPPNSAVKSKGVTIESTPVHVLEVSQTQAPTGSSPKMHRAQRTVVFPPIKRPAQVPFFSGNTGGGRGGNSGNGGSGKNQPDERDADMSMSSGKYFIVGILALIGGLGNILVAIYSSYLPTTREGYAENTQRRAAYIITEANSSYERCLQLWKKQGSGLSISIPSTTGAGPAIGVSEPQVTLPNCSAALRDQLNAATAIINNRYEGESK